MHFVISHPSGFFIRGDNSRLDGIARKLRARPEKNSSGAGHGRRRVSTTSSGSVDAEDMSPVTQGLIPLPPVPDLHPSWNAQQSSSSSGVGPGSNGALSGSPSGLRALRLPEYRTTAPNAYTSPSSTGPSLNHTGYSFGTGGQSYALNSARLQDISSWRSYTPATTKWSNASSLVSSLNSSNSAAVAAARRASISDFKASSSQRQQAPPGGNVEYMSPTSERPKLRKAGSTMCIQTTEQPQAHGIHTSENTYASSYPTPTYPPSASFTNPWNSSWSPNQQMGNPSTRLPYAFAHPWSTSSAQTDGETRRYYDNGPAPHQQMPSRSDSIDYSAAVAGPGDIHDGLPSPSASHSNPVTPADELPNPLGYDPRKFYRPQSNALGLDSISPHAVSNSFSHHGITQAVHVPYGSHVQDHDDERGNNSIYFAENRAPLWQPSSSAGAF